MLTAGAMQRAAGLRAWDGMLFGIDGCTGLGTATFGSMDWYSNVFRPMLLIGRRVFRTVPAVLRMLRLTYSVVLINFPFCARGCILGATSWCAVCTPDWQGPIPPIS